MIYPLSSRKAPSRGMLYLSQYSCTFSHIGHAGLFSCYAFYGLATCITSSSLLLSLSTFMFEHFHFWCSTPQHLKYFTFSSSLFCHLIFTSLLILYYITQLINTLNLFLEIGFLSSSPILFLQLWTRCPNFLQLKHFLLFFSSSSALSLVKVCHWLSMMLIKESYYLRNIVLCPLMLNKIDLTNYCYVCWSTRSLSNQTATAVLTTALIK